MVEKPTIAAFDFDGTLTYRDTLLPFLFFTTPAVRAIFYLFLCLPFLIGFVFGLVSRQSTKEAVLRRFFQGSSIEKLRSLGKQFADRKLTDKLRPEAMEKLYLHLKRGDRCLLVSASLDIYLKPWAENVGIQEILTSQLEVAAEGRVTGSLLGKNCWGAEKSRRLEEALGRDHQYTLYAYGNSRGDREMLAMADYPSLG